jgi:hypothetical protein
VRLVEEDIPFPKDQGRMLNNHSPVKMVRNPDGSLDQASMLQVCIVCCIVLYCIVHITVLILNSTEVSCMVMYY